MKYSIKLFNGTSRLPQSSGVATFAAWARRSDGNCVPMPCVSGAPCRPCLRSYYLLIRSIAAFRSKPGRLPARRTGSRRAGPSNRERLLRPLISALPLAAVWFDLMAAAPAPNDDPRGLVRCRLSMSRALASRLLAQIIAHGNPAIETGLVPVQPPIGTSPVPKLRLPPGATVLRYSSVRGQRNRRSACG